MGEFKERTVKYQATDVVQTKLFTVEADKEKEVTAKGLAARHKRGVPQALSSTTDIVPWVTDGKYDRKTLKLFDDVSQVYELLLARMEFLALGDDLPLLRQRAAYFEEVKGEKTNHFFLSGVRGKGQIGHSNQYLTHWFYPYKGKFHGQMIKALVNFMGLGSDSLVLDPFLGSGTTLVEASTMGIPSVGIEINPALCIVSQIKLDCLSFDYPGLSHWLREMKPLEIFNSFSEQEQKGRNAKWSLGFDQLNQNAKNLLKFAWDGQFSGGHIKDLPGAWKNFLLLCYLHALSDYTYLKGTNKERSFSEFFIRDLNEYLDTISGTYRVLLDRQIHLGNSRVVFGTALDVPLASESVDGIVTSPPYSIALNYVKNDEHLLNYLGIDTSQLQEQILGLKGKKEEKLRLYERDIRKSIQEMHRVLKHDSYAAILLGDVVVGNIRTNFARRIVNWSTELGFAEAELIRRPILGGYARLRYEYIILLKKR